MKKLVKTGLCLLLCGVMLLSLTACSADVDYYYGTIQLKYGNYAKAYEHLKSSSDPRAEELLENFIFVPVTHGYKDTYNTGTVEYTYGEDGYPLKVTRTVLNSNRSQTVTVEEYSYTDSVLRQYTRTYNYADGDSEGELTTYDERGLVTYHKTTTHKGDTLEEIFYAYDEDGNLLTRDYTYTYDGSELYDREEYTYDEQGRPLTYKQDETYYGQSTTEKTYVYAEDGSYVVHEKRADESTIRGDSVVQENYDVKGRLVRRTYKNKTHGGEQLEEYQYDSAGNLVRFTSRVDGRTSTTTHQFNEAGLLLEEKIVNDKGNTEQRVTKTYDEQGRLLTEETDYGTINSIKKTYVYDQQGNLVTESQSGQGASWHTITHTYNPDGTLKMTEKVGTTGTYTAAYGYDEQGNRVEGLYQSTGSSGNKREVTATATWELHYFPDGVPEEIEKQIELMTWQ